MYNYRTPCWDLLLSSPLISLFLPTPSPHPHPFKHASNQYRPNQWRVGMQSAPRSSRGRKEKAVCHCSVCLTLFLCHAPLFFSNLSVSNCTQTATPQEQLLLFLLTSRCLFLGKRVFKEGCCSTPKVLFSLSQQGNFSSFSQCV